MELPGHAEIQQVVRHEESTELPHVAHLRHRDRDVQVDEPVQDEVHKPAEHPLHALLVHAVRIRGLGRAQERTPVDDREHREAHVREEEEVRDPVPDRDRLLHVAQVVHVDDDAEHEHGREHRPDGTDQGTEDLRLRAAASAAPARRRSETRVPNVAGKWQIPSKASPSPRDPPACRRPHHEEDPRHRQKREERKAEAGRQNRLNQESGRREARDLPERRALQLETPLDDEQEERELSRDRECFQEVGAEHASAFRGGGRVSRDAKSRSLSDGMGGERANSIAPSATGFTGSDAEATLRFPALCAFLTSGFARAASIRRLARRTMSGCPKYPLSGGPLDELAASQCFCVLTVRPDPAGRTSRAVRPAGAGQLRSRSRQDRHPGCRGAVRRTCRIHDAVDEVLGLPRERRAFLRRRERPAK